MARHPRLLKPKPPSQAKPPHSAPRKRPRTALVLIALVAIAGSSVYSVPQIRAWYHAAAAERARRRGDYPVEYRHRKDCLEVWSDSPEAYFLAARAARRAGDFRAAEQLLARCARLQWVPEAVHGEELLLRLGRGDAGIDPAELFACAQTMEADQPELPLTLEAATRSYLQSYRLIDVQQVLNFWLERDPRSVPALLYRGWVLASLYQTDAALADYRQALTLDPDSEEARLRLAETLWQARQPEAALEHFQVLERRQPGNPAVLLGLARCERGTGQASESRRVLDRLLGPGQLRAVRALSEAVREGRPPSSALEAANWYRQAVASAPYDLRGQPQYVVTLFVAALVERSKLAMEEDQNGQAETWLRQAVTLDPFNYPAINQLAYCLERLGRQEAAQQYRARLKTLRADQERLLQVTRAITEHPHDPALRTEAGVILLRNGQPRDGLRWLYSAVHEDPRHRPAHEALARYYEATHQADKAAYHQKSSQKK